MFSLKAGLTCAAAGIGSYLFSSRRQRTQPQNGAQNDQNNRVRQAGGAALQPRSAPGSASAPRSAKNNALGESLSRLGSRLGGSVSDLLGGLRRRVQAAPEVQTAVTNATRLASSFKTQTNQLIESSKQAIQDPKNQELAKLMGLGLGLAGLGYLASQVPVKTGLVPDGMAQKLAAIANGTLVARIGSYVSDPLIEDVSRYKRISRTVFYAGLSFISPLLPLGVLAGEAVNSIRDLRAEGYADAVIEASSGSDSEAEEEVEIDPSEDPDYVPESDSEENDGIQEDLELERIPRDPSLVNLKNTVLQIGTKAFFGGLGSLLMSHSNPFAVQSGVAVQAGAAAALIHSSSTLEALPEVTGGLLLATGVAALNTPAVLIAAIFAGTLLNFGEFLARKTQ